MAKLIACRACGNQISKEARACPKCGAPPKRIRVLPVLAAVVAVFVVAGVVGAKDRGARSSASSAAAAGPPVDVSADKLAGDYKANEVSADEMYRGKVLRVSGVIDSIRKGITDDPYVVLKTNNQFMGVHANFDDASGLSGLAAGKRITVRCIGNNVIMGSPMLKDCVLE